MDTAWANLQNLGAVDENDRLTALGRHIVSFDEPHDCIYSLSLVNAADRLALSQNARTRHGLPVLRANTHHRCGAVV